MAPFVTSQASMGEKKPHILAHALWKDEGLKLVSTSVEFPGWPEALQDAPSVPSNPSLCF